MSEASAAVVAPSGPVLPHTVVVHPLVLLSVVDHYNRVAKGTDRRVVGVLLGETFKGKIDVTNSYAVPFDEDRKDPTVWFLDHNYHEDIFAMFRKVAAKEKVVGWYSTGPKIRPADIDINELMRKYCPEPVLVIIDVNPVDDLTIPTEAYRSVENSAEERSENRRTFVHIQSAVGAFEAEEVGVEQLLRDIRDTTVSTLNSELTGKLTSLKGLEKHLREIHDYLNSVLDGHIPANHQIMYNLQDIFNLSPNLRVENIVKAFTTKTNDSMLVIYLSSLIRSIVALHDLINNKLVNKDAIKKKLDLIATKKQEKADKAAEKEKEKAEKNKDKGEKAETPRSS